MKGAEMIGRSLLLLVLAGAGCLLLVGCGDNGSPKPQDLGTIYVNAVTGSDTTGSGAPAKPFKTITHALVMAHPGNTIQVAPGLYDAANGEAFPIVLTDSITLIGEDWETAVISGHRESDVLPLAINVVGDQCVLRRFTLQREALVSHNWYAAVQVSSTSYGALLDSIRCSESCEGAVANLDYCEAATVSNCYFVVTGGDRENSGFQIWDDYGGNAVRNSTVKGFERGIITGGLSDVLVEACTIEDNDYGFDIACWNIPACSSNPDLGGGARGSLGGNIIRSYATCGIYNVTGNTIYARFNTWQNFPPTEGVDFRNLAGGSVVWE
jgi:hypothetical protein